MDANKKNRKKLNGNYKRMLWAILDKSWKQHSTTQQQSGHLPSHLKNHPSKMNKTCKTAGEESTPISDVLQWTPTHVGADVGGLTRTHLHQLCIDIGCSLEDMLGAMDDRDE